MPRPLLDRLRPDSIAEFRLAASDRYRDGEAAAIQDRRTGAIYLWGYAVEMLLKAAYFQVDGFGERQPIKYPDLKKAVDFGRSIGISWPQAGQLHRIPSWGETLVGRRQQNAAYNYFDIGFEREVLSRSRQFHRIWSETLRYHANVAHPYELRQIRSSTEWFLIHSLML